VFVIEENFEEAIDKNCGTSLTGHAAAAAECRRLMIFSGNVRNGSEAAVQ
jgi:hypothetical protein